MTSVLDLHARAMRWVDQAEEARKRGDISETTRMYRLALKGELRAIERLRDVHPNVEPTWSVMHASAASIALRAGEFRTAERLIGIGLAGDATDDVLEELRDLLDEVQHRRHLGLHGVHLSDAQFQISLAGRSVGHGSIVPEVAQRRTDSLRRLLERTAERKAQVPFRSDGQLSSVVRGGIVIQFSPPRAASYALTVSVERRRGEQLRLPMPGEPLAPIAPDPAEIVSEMFDCVRLVEEGRFDDLRARINDDDYFTNFMSLARVLAPDGRDIKTVGFTRNNGKGSANKLSFRRRSRSIEVPVPTPGNAIRATLSGVLDGADGQMTHRGTLGFVMVVDDAGVSHALRVPKSILADIVRPRFGEKVTVVVLRHGEGDDFVELVDEPAQGSPRSETPGAPEDRSPPLTPHDLPAGADADGNGGGGGIDRSNT